VQGEGEERSMLGQAEGNQSARKQQGEGMKMARRVKERVRTRQGEGEECTEGNEKAKR
jgi:hypothetical protein